MYPRASITHHYSEKAPCRPFTGRTAMDNATRILYSKLGRRAEMQGNCGNER
jgi:hypothetical protein